MSATILINEAHPNPESGNEWIELYITQEPAEEFSLNNFTLFDSARQIYKFTNQQFINQILVVEVSGLNNDSDSVILKNSNSEILDALTYDKTEKGLSWSRNLTDNTFALTAPSRNLINPTPTPTTTPTLTPTATSTPTITPTTTAVPIPTSTPKITSVSNSNNLTSVQTTTMTASNKSVVRHLIDLDKIKLSSHDKSYLNRNLRLVFLNESLERNLIINAIIGSSLIILASLILIYGKIKNHQHS